MTYRPELDAFRGIAVLLVIGGHLYLPGLLGGGNVGVTLFFVLSGYLNTSILREDGSLKRFYFRRLRRLVPALVLWLAVMVIVGVVSPSQTIPPLLYIANWATLSGQLAEPLHHTWTLATEEQFYLIWPMVLILMPRPTALVVGLIVAGLLLSIAAPLSTPALALGPYTAIAWGCLLGLGVVPRFPRIVVGLGLAVLVAFLVAPPSDDEAVNRLAPLLGLAAFAVLSALTHRETGPLAIRPLMGVGRISYGLYLWHYPFVLLSWRALSPGQPGIVDDIAWTVGVIAATFGCAVLSWFIVERRFLAPRSDKGQRLRPSHAAPPPAAIGTDAVPVLAP